MNTNPHTHKPKLYESDMGDYKIIYGDTRVGIGRGLLGWFGGIPTQKQIDKAFKKAVAKHDRGSQVAVIKKSARDYTASLSQETEGHWASD